MRICALDIESIRNEVCSDVIVFCVLLFIGCLGLSLFLWLFVMGLCVLFVGVI